MDLAAHLGGKQVHLLFHLLRSILQADEFPINVYLFDADVASGRGGMGDADAATRLRLFHVHPLPLPSHRANTATGRSS